MNLKFGSRQEVKRFCSENPQIDAINPRFLRDDDRNYVLTVPEGTRLRFTSRYARDRLERENPHIDNANSVRLRDDAGNYYLEAGLILQSIPPPGTVQQLIPPPNTGLKAPQIFALGFCTLIVFGFLVNRTIADPSPPRESVSKAVQIGYPPVNPSGLAPSLVEGDKGPNVEILQELLKYHHDSNEGFSRYMSERNLKRCTVDGDFGPVTTATLKAFQQYCGIEVSGQADQKTWDMLNKKEIGDLY